MMNARLALKRLEAGGRCEGGRVRITAIVSVLSVYCTVWALGGAIQAKSVAREDTIQVFDEYVRLSYGDSSTIAPLKAGACPMDWNRDGMMDLRVLGRWWQNTGQKRGDMPIYRSMGRARFDGTHLVDLNINGRDDAVRLKDRHFVLSEDASNTGERNFVELGRLQFAQGDDLRLPDSHGTIDHTGIWKLWCVGDLDSDGRLDLLTSKWTSEQLDNDDAYAPWKYCDSDVGWIDDQWIFHDFSTTFWWHRNVGTPREPTFTMARLLTTGQFNRGLTFPNKAVSAYLLDFDEDRRTDVFAHVSDYSLVFLNIGQKENGIPLFDEGHRIQYGGADGIDHRKAAVPYRAEDGLIHIFFHGGSVIYEAVQLNKDDPFAFSSEHMVLFENPTVMRLDIFAVPDVADWEGDGKLDMIVGTEAGNIWLMRNLDPEGRTTRWAPPELLQADGKDIRLYKHRNLQGPEEYLIGYSNPTVEDWDLDGDLDIVAGCHGETYYLFENIGTRTEPELASRGPIRYGEGSVTRVSCAWRTRPGVGDVTGDGLPDLVGVDESRKLCLWRRYRDKVGSLQLAAPEYPVDADGNAFINCRTSRGIGRSKLCIVDWDQDGRLDVISSPNLNTSREFMFYYRNMGMKNGKLVLDFQPNRIKVVGLVPRGKQTHFRVLEPVDFDRDGRWEAITGMDTGYVYYWPEMEIEAGH